MCTFPGVKDREKRKKLLKQINKYNYDASNNAQCVYFT